MKSLITRFTENPKTLLLFDSGGAFMTAFLLYMVVRPFYKCFGMPQNTSTYLAIVALCFCVYSATSYVFLKENLTPYLKVIGIANFLYCALLMGLLIKFYPLLTTFGMMYFLIEISVICALSYAEIKVADAIKNYNHKA